MTFTLMEEDELYKDQKTNTNRAAQPSPPKENKYNLK